MSQLADAKLTSFFHRLDKLADDTVLDLPGIKSWPTTRHRFQENDLWAIRAALAANRPLLVRGEPGIGKSQLARAAAHVLRVPFLYKVIDARCECTDLLYDYDAVSRLAQAQVLGQRNAPENWRDQLLEVRFVRPGILWWAFDWNSALTQSKRYHDGRNPHKQSPSPAAIEPVRPEDWEPGDGCVVLIDEIDKADTDVPNGLLEALGNMGFDVPLTGEGVAMSSSVAPPLVVVTTNEERELPAAFLRRCLVHPMRMEDHPQGELGFLLDRGRDHFDDQISEQEVYQQAAQQLLEDRRASTGHGLVKPGAAEYIDLLRALTKLCPDDVAQQIATLAKIERFALDKNPEESAW